MSMMRNRENNSIVAVDDCVILNVQISREKKFLRV